LFSVFNRKIIEKSLFLLLVFCSVFSNLQADSSPLKFSIPNIVVTNESYDSLVIDGSLQESIWNQALEIELGYEIEPGENIPSNIKTKAYIFEDSEYLYIGIDAHDPNPKQIRAYLSPRDKLNLSDFVQIRMDTFNDSRKAYQFQVNAIGVQGDAIIDETTGKVDSGWDAIWQSAGKLSSKGFQVEIKIPFKSLRFKESQIEKIWGIQFTRIWHRDVTHIFSSSPKNRSSDCSLCQFKRFTGLKSSHPTNNLTLILALTVS